MRRGAWRELPDFIALFMGLIRYRPTTGTDTDIVITVSVPHVPGKFEPDPQSTGPLCHDSSLMAKGALVRDRIVQSLEVVDDALFGNS